MQGSDGPANHKRLCVKGRFGFDYVAHPHRLTTPLVRRDDAPKAADCEVDPAGPFTHFRAASWEEALIGPRQVGKTTLALEIGRSRDALYLDLEDRDDRNRLAEPALFLDNAEDRLVILDEIHRMPGLFRTLRGIIDRGRRKGKGRGRFLILGSASIGLLRQSGETLAGRISVHRPRALLRARSGGRPRSARAPVAARRLSGQLPRAERPGQPGVAQGLHPHLSVEPARAFVVHADDDRYPVSENVEGIGIRALAAELRARA